MSIRGLFYLAAILIPAWLLGKGTLLALQSAHWAFVILAGVVALFVAWRMRRLSGDALEQVAARHSWVKRFVAWSAAFTLVVGISTVVVGAVERDQDRRDRQAQRERLELEQLQEQGYVDTGEVLTIEQCHEQGGRIVADACVTD